MVGDYISTSFTGDGKAHPGLLARQGSGLGRERLLLPEQHGLPPALDERDLRHHAPAADSAGEDAEGARRARAAQAPRRRAAHAPDRELARRNRALEPAPQLGQERRVDRVRERVLAVEDLRACAFEQLLRLPAPLDSDDRVERPVADRDRRERRVEVELEALDRSGRSRSARSGPQAGAVPRRARARSSSSSPARSRRARFARAGSRSRRRARRGTPTPPGTRAGTCPGGG